ncbi:phage portal protein [Massilia sp. TS11]|uniref:phage portal protein n=1 Tax=Massilia sp. TS11 TaxID=2908003 RepID=UPI001EDC5F3C|nr:phage portal protein [Massilia sp. TS11]MCG2586502.1 phage portal protein [Massilia sp. TS11]
MSGLLTKLLGGPTDAKGGLMDKLLDIIGGGIPSKAGPGVNWKTALRVSTALSCGRVLAEGISQVPFKLMLEQESGGSELARKHPLYNVLARRPNDWMTPFEFRETMMYHAIFARGGHAVINRVNGKVYELLPVMPDRIRAEQKADTTLVYWIRMQDGIEREFPRESIFRVRGPSWDGVEGMDIIDLAREALGLALATEETHARLHKNGAKAAGVISVDGKLSSENREYLKKTFIEATTGDKAYKTLVLDQGAKFSQMSMNGVDSQHLETRRFQIEEVCRAFRVFPQMVGYADKTATFASAEQFFIAHVVHSLTPWAERFEQAADRDMLTKKEVDAGYYTKLQLQGLLRGDVKSRGEFYVRMFGIGAMNPNQIRALEDMNPYDGGEKYFVPMNMADIAAIEKGINNGNQNS